MTLLAVRLALAAPTAFFGWVVAETNPVPGIPGWVWGLLSAAGGFATAVLSGKIVVPTFAYNREKEKADKWEAEAMRLNAAIADKHAGALEASSAAVRESTETVKQAIAAMGRRRTT